MEKYTLSIQGKRKNVNEDSFGICHSSDGRVFFAVVADGMGGHLAGDVASNIAVESFLERARQLIYEGEDELCEFVVDTVVDVNDIVEETAAENPSTRNMGSTFVMIAAVINEKKAVVCNIGDSRAYRFDGMSVSQITKDHSIAQLMLDKGYTKEQTRKYLKRNSITKAIGFLSGEGDSGMPDIFKVDWREDDIFMLCSDGLSSVLDEFALGELFAKYAKKTCREFCNILANEAVKKGSDDDITVTLIRL